MIRFYDLAQEDLVWLVRELGEEVVYKPQGGGEFRFFAVVDRNAESPPAYGYEQTLSQKHHVFCFLRGELPCALQRGDCVVVQGVCYSVDFVFADDDVVWRVAGR